LLYKKGQEYTEKRKKIEKDNLQTEKEKEAFMSQIELNMIKKCYENYGDDCDLMNSFILMSVLTDQPPLRNSTYHTMIFIDDIKKDDNTENFICVSKNGEEYKGMFIINDDKHKSKIKEDSKKEKEEKEEKFIEIYPTLAKNIYDSYNAFPRKKLFMGIETNEQFLILLKKTTLNDGITFNLCRSSYKIHQHYLNPHMSINEKEKLAKQMRHTFLTAEQHYLKSDVSKNYNIQYFTQKGEIIVSKIMENIKNNKVSKNAINEIKFSLEEYKETSEYKKKKNDVIRLANKNGKTIKDSTIAKYDIKHDGEKYI
jgi:hypothetical protein